MTLQQLRQIIQVADSGSINEAAKRLFITQPRLKQWKKRWGLPFLPVQTGE